jgi:hypothetical protein
MYAFAFYRNNVNINEQLMNNSGCIGFLLYTYLHYQLQNQNLR